MEDKIYCPKCGAPNEKNNRFCGICGVNLIEVSIEEAKTVQITGTPTQQPAQVVYVYPQQEKKQPITVLGVTGMIIGIISLLILSWVSFFSYFFMPFIYLAFSIIGIIISAMSVKENTAIGVTGLVTSIIGGLSQIGWCILSIIFYLSYW